MCTANHFDSRHAGLKITSQTLAAGISKILLALFLSIALITSAVAADPADPDALETIRMLTQIGQLESARLMADGYIEQHPRDPEGYLTRAYCLDKAGRDGLPDVLRVLELDPRNFGAWLLRAKLLHNRHDFPQAVEALDQCIAVRPPTSSVLLSKLYEMRGTNKAFAGDFDGAVKDLSKSIDMGVSGAAVYHCRGLAEAELSLFEPARQDLKTAIELYRSAGNDIARREAEKALARLPSAAPTPLPAFRTVVTDKQLDQFQRVVRATNEMILSHRKPIPPEFLAVASLSTEELRAYVARAKERMFGGMPQSAPLTAAERKNISHYRESLKWIDYGKLANGEIPQLDDLVLTVLATDEELKYYRDSLLR